MTRRGGTTMATPAVLGKRQPDAADSASGTAKRPTLSHSADRVHLIVGGEHFHTSKVTLRASSFFSAMFDGSWREADDDEIFVDRDPDSFRVLLSCLRAGRAILPEHDTNLCIRALLDAQFYGMESLLEEIKSTAYCHIHPGASRGAPKLSPSEKFDKDTGGILDAIDKGLLPERFFKAAPPPPKIRSFAAIVEGSSILNKKGGIPGKPLLLKAGAGEVVHIQSAVIAGVAELRRLVPSTIPEDPSSYAQSGTNLACSRYNGSGDFQLQYMGQREYDNKWADDEPIRIPFNAITHRGIDFVQQHDDEGAKDIQFREELDLVLQGSIYLRARGLCDWHVHGWIGPLDAIHRAGSFRSSAA